MAFWIIVGSAVFGAWAMLSVVGSELTRRTRQLEVKSYEEARKNAPRPTLVSEKPLP